MEAEGLDDGGHAASALFAQDHLHRAITQVDLLPRRPKHELRNPVFDQDIDGGAEAEIIQAVPEQGLDRGLILWVLAQILGDVEGTDLLNVVVEPSLQEIEFQRYELTTLAVSILDLEEMLKGKGWIFIASGQEGPVLLCEGHGLKRMVELRYAANKTRRLVEPVPVLLGKGGG